MSYKIVVDSSSNLKNDYIVDKDVAFEVVPLTIRLGEEEFVDNENLNVEEMLKKSTESKAVGKTSCPSPNDFLKAIEGYDNVIVITISSKLSGSFNSATVAKGMVENANIIVIDSLLVCGAMRILADEAYKLIKEGKSMKEIESSLLKKRDSNQLLFVLNKFDNLVKNGRMSKVTAFIASMIAIKPLCVGEDGEIKIKEKIRTFQGVLKRLVVTIGKMVNDTTNRVCIISHTDNLSGALSLQKEIKEKYKFKDVIIEENRGLSAFYSSIGGIIVSF